MVRPIDPAREEARARGDKRYISERACPQSHFERFVINAGCYVCQTIRQQSTPKPPKPIKVECASVTPLPKVSRPEFARALAEYHYSQEGRERSRRLNRLIKGPS